MGVKVDGLEAAFVSENFVKSIEGTCVGSIARVV